MDGLKLGNVGPVAELLERLIAEAVAQKAFAAREEGWRDGYALGRAEECQAWRVRVRALLGEAGDHIAEAGKMVAGDGEDAQRDGVPPHAVDTQEPGPAPAGDAGAPPEVPHAPPAGAALVWEDWRTPAREAVLRQMWPQGGVSMRALYAALAAVEGPKMPADAENVRHWGKKIGLGPRPLGPVEKAPKVAPEPEPVPEADHLRETPQMVRARELLGMGLHPNDIKLAVRLTAVEFGEVCRLHKAAA